ncbi:MAG: MFS transporter, partial [Planctomycetota bacterium]
MNTTRSPFARPLSSPAGCPAVVLWAVLAATTGACANQRAPSEPERAPAAAESPPPTTAAPAAS